ncbi:acetoacetate decarboxylase family protein [Pseudonocardia acaciae]|uniref:acetoacetate decarboxylase family protein n=1 Tax=Pseudonocardia acaciae TaxID=551276 RepID=UPI000A7D28E8|nr:acetoacetate decarboxylase family protein [Pseudonocardia acaciae]
MIGMPPFAPLFGVGAESVTVRWLTVQYRTRADIVASLLPAPLQPADDALAAIWVAEFLGAEFRLPDGTTERRPPYPQAGISVRCRHGDQLGAYPLTFFIEGLNHGTLGREIFGLPKKQARSVLLREDPSGVTGGVTSANGIDVVTVRAHRPPVEPAAVDPIPDWFAHHFPLKLIPSAEGTGYDVNKLVQVPFRTSGATGGWVGTGDVVLTPSTADPLHLVECVEVVEARYGRVDLEVGFGTYLERVDEIPTFGVPDWS